MKLIALVLALLLVAQPAYPQSPFVFGAGGQAKALNQNGISLKTGQTLNYDGQENWIKNGGAEDPTIVGVSTYDDGAVTAPTDCTGGSPSIITRSISTSSPPTGLGKYLISKALGDATGEGVAFDLVMNSTNPAAAISTAAQLIFDHSMGSNYVDNDVGVYVYDVNGSGGMQSLGSLAEVNLTQTKTFPWITTGGGVTTFRVCFHWQANTNDATSFNLDNVYSGIRNWPTPIMPYADSVPWPSMAGSWVSNTNYSGMYWIRGNLFSAKGVVTVSGGAPTSATLTITLPNGWTVDQTQMRMDAAGLKIIGPAWIKDASTSGRYKGNITYVAGASNNLRMTYEDQSANTVDTIDNATAAVTQAAPFTFADTDTIEFDIINLPITELSISANASPGAQCEYAATSGTWDANSSTTVFGFNGQAIGGTLTGGREKTVTFTRAVRFIRVLGGKTPGGWSDMEGSELGASNVRVIRNENAANTAFSGTYWRQTGTNTVVVTFGRYARLSTDDDTTEWPSSDAYWVVENCPTAQGSIVYAMAGLNTPGLVSSQYQYTTNSTMTFNGSGGSTGSLAFVYERMGDWIKLYFPVAQATTGTGSTGLVSNTALETWARPATTVQICSVNSIRNNGGGASDAGQLRIGTDGILTLRRDGTTGGTAWTNTAGGGTNNPTTCTYYVGTGS